MGSSPISSILYQSPGVCLCGGPLFLPNICPAAAVACNYHCQRGGTTQYCFQPHSQTQHARAKANPACIFHVGARQQQLLLPSARVA